MFEDAHNTLTKWLKAMPSDRSCRFCGAGVFVRMIIEASDHNEAVTFCCALCGNRWVLIRDRVIRHLPGPELP